jgi:hypothetical protein
MSVNWHERLGLQWARVFTLNRSSAEQQLDDSKNTYSTGGEHGGPESNALNAEVAIYERS